MFTELNVAFDADAGAAAPRVLAVVDHLDAPSSWLIAALLGARCDAPQAVVCVAVERAPKELVALARKVAKGARDGARRAVERGACAFVDAHASPYGGAWSVGDGVGDGAVVAASASGLPGRELVDAIARAVVDVQRACRASEPTEPTEPAASSRTCVIIDGTDALEPMAKGAALEKFLDDVYALDEALDVIVCAHGDVGAASAWIDDNADCVIRLEPLKTGSAEDVHGACETTHKTNAFRAEGRARRTRARYAVSELGVKITVAPSST